MAEPLAELNDTKFKVVLTRSPNGPRIDFSGTVSGENPTKLLNPFFDVAHNTVSAWKARALLFDFQALEFLNSSGFKSFVYLIQKIKGLSENERYKIIFRLNPARRWQSTSVHSLRCFSPELVDVDE